MKNVLFFLALFVLSVAGSAQNFNLQGKVFDENGPIEGVSVFVKETGEGTTTNGEGLFLMELSEGVYTLIFTYANQKTMEIHLTEDKFLEINMSTSPEVLDEVFLSSVRVKADSPITYSNLSNEQIEDRNLGQDIPALMNFMPNVVTTSDAGAGIGYTGLRVRGSDATRVNVTINGIPYNDSESQGTFWVNLGDFASSVQNLQLQRGVGTSTNGAGAFGASLNILTDAYRIKPSAEIANSFGSFNTRKHTLKFSTGKLNDYWSFSGRVSKIESDGYIDRANTDLKSYFFQGSYHKGNTLIKALTFGGKERTYQAWYGIDAETLNNDRTFNPAGMYTDEDGNIHFYDNQTDNYQQDHYQLLWNQKYNSNWSSNIGLHYTKGAGYYQEFEEDADLIEFGLEPFMVNGEEMTTSDLVGTKNLDNDFFGSVFSLNFENEKTDVIVGGGWNKYIGDHFGEVIYTRFAQNNEPHTPYYENEATKTDFNIFGKATFSISEKLAAYVDLQLRKVKYETSGILSDGSEFLVDDELNFFNPKAGLTYKFNRQNQLYFSFARAHREPSRDDYENGDPEPEELNDYELGWRFNTKTIQINTNLYFMDYRNQLVLTGEIDDVGASVRQNSGKSYRTGLEIDAAFKISDLLSIRPNVSLSQNKNVDFYATVDDELQSFGDTEISFSPSIVAGNIISLTPLENFEINLLSKYVGEQYMSNTEAEGSILDAYFVNDLNLQYTWKSAPLFKEVVFTGLINNIFSEEYVSNGWYDSGWVGYYPQATINFLAGVSLKF
ncbi:MAG TPA: TonB-dependent receptor [Salinimicrobium sp.]|nr:TonB-dependent receptor [Salinimicrobium sp.]